MNARALRGVLVFLLIAVAQPATFSVKARATQAVGLAASSKRYSMGQS